MFQNRLSKVYRHLSRQAKRLGVTCYRVYDHDIPEFPFCVEFYGDQLYVAEYKRKHSLDEEEHETWLSKSIEIITNVLGVQPINIFLKLRQRKQGRGGQYQKQEERKAEFIVEENGLKFIVNLSDYLDTGLFLDHRVTRQLVREESNQKNVLNLFAYTGSFSVYAAAGGASSVTTVDLSNTYIKWAERNMKLNGFEDSQRYKYAQDDVMNYLKTITPDYYDLIVLDPPTFSNSKRMDDILDIQRDHVSLINDCIKGLKTGGQLYFSTNYRKFVLEKEAIQSQSITDITKRTIPFDFESRNPRVCYLVKKN